MASAKENVPLAPPQPLPRQTSRPRPPPPTPLRPKMANGATDPPPTPPLRPKMANGATDPPPVGVLKCMCFRLPSRTSKKPPPPLPAAPKLRSASSRSAVAPVVSAARASQSQRVTSFRASVYLVSKATPAPAGSGSVVAPRRASASSAVAPTTMEDTAVTASSSSFSHWRRRSLSASRVMPHGERASFSFGVSPASSCTSTPKIPQGWQWQQK